MSMSTELGKVLEALIDKVIGISQRVKEHDDLLNSVANRLDALEAKELKKEKHKK